MKYNFALIAENDGFRREVSDYFARSTSLECVMAVGTVEKFLKYHRDFMNIRLVLMDVVMAQQLSIFDIKHILQREPDAHVIMLTDVDDAKMIMQAFFNGATGYMFRDIGMEALEKCLSLVLQGKGAVLNPLVARELIQYMLPRSGTSPDVGAQLGMTLHMLKEGRTYKEVSERLGISVDGVRYYVKTIYKKFGVTSKGELIRSATW